MIRMIPSGLDDSDGTFGGMIRMILSGLDDSDDWDECLRHG